MIKYDNLAGTGLLSHQSFHQWKVLPRYSVCIIAPKSLQNIIAKVGVLVKRKSVFIETEVLHVVPGIGNRHRILLLLEV